MSRFPMLVAAALLAACRPDKPSPATPVRADLQDRTGSHKDALGPFHDLGDGLFCGGQPRGEDGFAGLFRMGVRVVVSVDGTQPDLDSAHRHGLRYVHIPIGYSGIPEPERLRLIRSVREADGPVYIHCHHGRHRGPAAAAAVARALRGWDAKQAADWMRQAGTDPRYTGLYRDASRSLPVPSELLNRDRTPLPERVETPPRVQVMVAIDQELDALKRHRGPGFPGGSPDRGAAATALRLSELLAESARENAPGNPAMMSDLQETAADARRLSDLLESGVAASVAESGFKSLVSRCSECHRRHRDNPALP